MPSCFFCNNELEITGRVMRKNECPRCRRDLHCCVQCRFHDPGCHNQCREPKSEMVRDREKANLCDYFEFRGAKGGNGEDALEKTKSRLDELFKKK
jgi:hypothetical protein